MIIPKKPLQNSGFFNIFRYLWLNPARSGNDGSARPGKSALFLIPTVMKPARLFGMLLAGVFAAFTFSPASALELTSTRRIWDQAPHSAFTGLIDYEGKLYCCFREAKSHVPQLTGEDGKIRILVSDTGEAWEPFALVESQGTDLRDPQLSRTPDGRLMLLMGGSRYENGQFLGGISHVSFLNSRSRTFSAPIPIEVDKTLFPNKIWLWKITWHGPEGYATIYENDRLSLVKTSDGLHYDLVTRLRCDSMPNETALLFGPNDELYLLVRREIGGATGVWGESRPPYTEWEWNDLGIRLGGPNLCALPDGSILIGSREVQKEPHCGLYGLDGSKRAELLLRLPSGGDCSYPGFVVRGNTLWISYYSSHEGHAAIYLATVRLDR